MNEKTTGEQTRFKGIPEALRPKRQRTASPTSRFEVVMEADAPRDLEKHPFDYRNPFPLQDWHTLLSELNGPLTLPTSASVQDDDLTAFDYYCNDNAAIGMPGGPECALVDLHGTLRSYAGAWAFGIGTKAQAPAVRTRKLEQGWIPVIRTRSQVQNVDFRLTWFAAHLHGAPHVQYPFIANGSYQWWAGGPEPFGRNLFHCARGEIRVAQNCEFELHVGFAQAGALCSGAFYMNPRHSPPWERLEWRRRPSGRWLLVARHAGTRFCLAVLQTQLGVFAPSQTTRIRHWPTPLTRAPKRTAQTGGLWRGKLAAGRTARIALWVPQIPVPIQDARFMERANPAVAERQTIRTWRACHARRSALVIPEPKVNQAYRQALNHLDLCCVTMGKTQYPTPGPCGGHHIFYDRDAIDMIYAYDLAGEHARAERMIDYSAQRWGGQESSAMLLWLLGRHYALTRKPEWVRQVFPRVSHHMTVLIQLWAGQQAANDGLFPSHKMIDNELAQGRYVSYHLYAVAGLKAGAHLAAAIGESELAKPWGEFATRFERIVIGHLRALGRKTGGVITPTFEGLEAEPVKMTWGTPPRERAVAGAYGTRGGCDWHNIGAAWPTGVLAPHDPLVTSSLSRWRHTYVEGVFPYPSRGEYVRLHNYNGLNLSGTWLRRGDWAEAVRDLYGALLHTSSTHASAEVVNSSGRWDYSCTPHNWFSGKLVRCIRDLLAYEDLEGQLHLLGGLSPAWMQPGMDVGVRNLPTDYGTLTYTARMRLGGLRMDIAFRPHKDARGLVLHLPPFLRNVRVRAEGRPCRPSGKGWRLPVRARRVEATWTPGPLPDISFSRVVESFVADYQRRVAAGSAQ